MPADLDAAAAQVEAAFADAPRPADAELLHPDCADDMDIEHLYAVTDWLLDPPQRDAVAAFLEAMMPHHTDAASALAAWRAWDTGTQT